MEIKPCHDNKKNKRILMLIHLLELFSTSELNYLGKCLSFFIFLWLSYVPPTIEKIDNAIRGNR